MPKVTLDLPLLDEGWEYTGKWEYYRDQPNSIVPTTQRIRWRADRGEWFYFINGLGDIMSSRDHRKDGEDNLWKLGNYYPTDSAAQPAATAVCLLFKTQTRSCI